MRTRPAAFNPRLTGRPSTATSSPGSARSPSLATRPPTVTRPASIQDSMVRREPRPAAASSFCSRSARFSASGTGGCFGFGVGGTGAGFGGLDRLKLEGLGDFLERRQLLERAQAEVVEELAGGGVKRRAARRFAMADHVDPGAGFQALDDLGRDGHAADVLDVAAGYRLAVGDDRQRLHDRAGIARRFLGSQALDVGAELRGGLETPAARHVDQLDRPALPLLRQLAEEIAQRIGGDFAAEKALQLRESQRFGRGQQRSLEYSLYVRWAAHTLI